jgi:hypothetical protein
VATPRVMHASYCLAYALLQVGWVCSNYHNLYRRPRGMFFSSYDKGHMAAMVYNW